MTKEEAIRLLDLNREYLRNTNNIGLKDDIEALDMAIQALSQECVGSTQKCVGNALEMRCNDAINRPTVVKFEGTNMACMGGDEIMKEFENNTPQNKDDAISRKSIKQKLQENHDFFVNAYGGFSNLPQNDKARVDEITNCIAMVVNEPSVKPQICDDAISRQAVLDTEYQIKEINGIEYVMLSEVQMKMRKMPPVTQEPKTGHWISIDTGKQVHLKDGMTTESVKCSKCDEWLTASDEYACNGNYCPNCGARMVKPHERSEKE